MLQIRLLGQFDIRLDRKRITIPSRVGQSLFAYLALTAGTPHRREKLAGLFWPDTSDDVARKYLRQELWRIRKVLSAQQNDPEEYLLADEFTIGFNRSVSYWLDVAQLERPGLDLESLTSNLTLYQGELLPGFYENWIVLERERIQSIFDSRMGQLLDMLVTSNRWTAVQEQAERWLALGNSPEPAFRGLMLAYGARGDMVKVSSVYQRCISELKEHYGLEPSAETRALYDGLLKGANVPGRPALHPSGTVTFLFTDIEGSTNLLDKLGDQYADVLATHHKIMRDAIQKWNGREVDTQGDAFFVTFTRASDAVQCAADMQRTLQSQRGADDKFPFIRMGLHTGEPLIASTGYVGMDVHRAARIGDAAHGGQVLLSQATRELVINELPKAITIRDLGEHRLKDLKFPTTIYQLVIAGLVSDFPPVRTKFSGTEPPTPGEPPFKGLQYFDEADRDLFFGREVLTAKLIDRLRGSNFLSVIIGASGSGKSSLVRAGLIPALRNGMNLIEGTLPIDGSTAWQIHIMTPTAHPLETLAAEMTRDSDSATTAAAWIDNLMQDPGSLTHLLEKRDPTEHTLLVVDQFEELFTLCRDEFEREAFIDNMLRALAQVGDRFTLVFTLRADFYAHLAQYPDLRDAVAKQQEYIGPMSMEELRQAIEEPARRGHWAFEPGLVDLILRDIGEEPGALPLLSHALLETWKRRAGHVLTLKGYAEAGGVHGAIANTAESVYQKLIPEEQVIARDIFLRLTELGEGTEDTRRRASFGELMSDPEAAGEVRQVLNMLADARLLTLNEDTAEVAHEALIREWPTLREWLNEDREALQLHRRLTEAAHEWELLERDPGVLFRGAQLAQAREWAVLYPRALNAGEKAFLEASNNLEQSEIAEKQAQQKRELEAARKLAETERARAEEQTHSANRLRTRNRVITTVGTIALMLALLAGMFGVRSNQNEVRAEANFKQAEAQRLALEASRLLTTGGSAEQIALLSLRSMQTQYTTEGDAALAAAARLEYPVKLFAAGKDPIRDAAFSPDGKYILTGGDDQIARLLDFQSGQEVRRFIGHTGTIFRVYFSPDGKNVLTVDGVGNIIMWDAANGHEQYRIATESPMVWIAYSHDGKTIVTSHEDGTIRRWDAAGGKEIGVLLEMDHPVWIEVSPDDRYMLIINGTAQLWDLQSGQKIIDFSFDTSILRIWSFSPDGKYVLTGNLHGEVQLWDAKTGQEVRSFIGHTDPIFGGAFTPDHKHIVTSSADKTVRIWDIATGQELRRIIFSAFVDGLAASPDGKWILTGSTDGTIRLWSLDARPSYPIMKTGNAISALAFSPDGKSILTGGDDGIARSWDAQTGQHLRDFLGHTSIINYGAAFSPDGKHIVTGSYDSSVRLWDTVTAREVHQFTVGTGFVFDVRFSRDGTNLLTAGSDGVRLWDVETGEMIRQFGELAGVYRAAFSPDAKYVLTAAGDDDDGKARLWDSSTGELIQEYQSAQGEMSAVDFSPDGKYVIADGGDNIVRIWDTQTGKELRQLIGHTSVLFSVLFSPDGKTIATASVDNTARLWDFQTGQELRRFIGHTAAVENVAFSPDGKQIVTSSDDGTARLWDVDYHTTMDYLCSVLLRDFTDEERAQYGITDNVPTCPAK